MQKLFITFILTIALNACSQKIMPQAKSQQERTISLQTESKVFVLQNGAYILVNSEDKPKPTQGEEQFYRDMYSKMKYPANARENNIQGTVIFEVMIDENGKVENIEKLNSLSLDCDTEAQVAIERGCEKGFQPYTHQGETVKVKYLIPVKFKLR